MHTVYNKNTPLAIANGVLLFFYLVFVRFVFVYRGG